MHVFSVYRLIHIIVDIPLYFRYGNPFIHNKNEFTIAKTSDLLYYKVVILWNKIGELYMNPLDLIKDNWADILQKIKIDHDLSSISFDSWLKPLEIISLENDIITFLVPSGDMGIIVLNKKYSLPIKVAIAEIPD